MKYSLGHQNLLHFKFELAIYPASNGKQRPAFGVMKGSGNILGDIVIPALPETVWEVLQ